ncbi:phosphoadenylyl-sulfate reductase [Brackiella oedipodis]|uniref:phosphoadenylyl-sulfate reductase n=1 Tax=Brackiella oedipodis TaxID=124225 RepID=UPI000A070876|nr:phosphoadenylyl-sulfate reductase [Brackiella oedipodis]
MNERVNNAPNSPQSVNAQSPQSEELPDTQASEAGVSSLWRPALWQVPNTEALQHSEELQRLSRTLEQRLVSIAERFETVKLASSLAVEDMVLTDCIAKLKLPIQIFTLNTGMLNAETVALIEQVHAHWQIHLQQYTPDPAAVEQYIQAHGKYAFYESVDLRRECCRIRKIEPLNRALQHADAWLTGQRREQSVTRTELAFEEFDKGHQIAKFNPLFDWSEAAVWAYVQTHDLPINHLYYQGYPSIGCEPCTRPVKLHEDIRAGRWWWENQDTKECGLHR